MSSDAVVPIPMKKEYRTALILQIVITLIVSISHAILTHVDEEGIFDWKDYYSFDGSVVLIAAKVCFGIAVLFLAIEIVVFPFLTVCESLSPEGYFKIEDKECGKKKQ